MLLSLVKRVNVSFPKIMYRKSIYYLLRIISHNTDVQFFDAVVDTVGVGLVGLGSLQYGLFLSSISQSSAILEHEGWISPFLSLQSFVRSLSQVPWKTNAEMSVISLKVYFTNRWIKGPGSCHLTALPLCVVVEARIGQVNVERQPFKQHNCLNLWYFQRHFNCSAFDFKVVVFKRWVYLASIQLYLEDKKSTQHFNTP